MKYPAIDWQKWKNHKIHSSDIPKLQHLRRTGLTYKEIGEIYHVAAETIRYHLDERARMKRILDERKHRQIILQDPEFRKRAARKTFEWQHEQMRDRPEFAKWRGTFGRKGAWRVKRYQKPDVQRQSWRRKTSLSACRAFFRLTNHEPMNYKLLLVPPRRIKRHA